MGLLSDVVHENVGYDQLDPGDHKYVFVGIETQGRKVMARFRRETRSKFVVDALFSDALHQQFLLLEEAYCFDMARDFRLKDRGPFYGNTNAFVFKLAGEEIQARKRQIGVPLDRPEGSGQAA